MSNNWPTAPLIRIIHGEDDASHIYNTLATRDGDTYIIASGYHAGNAIDRDYATDGIYEWEEVVAIPTARLEELKKAWHGDGEYTPAGLKTLGDAVDPILSHLPADKPSALDRAVTRVKDAGGRMIDAESTQEERLSLLLDALASVQSTARKTAPLTMVARICAYWADFENPRRDSLEAARERTKVLSNPGSFIVLSALVGDVTTALCDNFSPRHDLIDAGAYALAWAAQIIEEEEDR